MWSKLDAKLGVVPWPPSAHPMDLKLLQLEENFMSLNELATSLSPNQVPDVEVAQMDVDCAATATTVPYAESLAEVEDSLATRESTAAAAAAAAEKVGPKVMDTSDSTAAASESEMTGPDVAKVLDLMAATEATDLVVSANDGLTGTVAAAADGVIGDTIVENPLFLPDPDEVEYTGVDGPVSPLKDVPGGGIAVDSGRRSPSWPGASEASNVMREDAYREAMKKRTREIEEAGREEGSGSGSERDSDEDHGRIKRQRVGEKKEEKEKKNRRGKRVAVGERSGSVSGVEFAGLLSC